MNILYSRQGCAPCVSLKRYLELKKIPYEVRDVADPVNMEDVVTLTGMSMVPVLKIDNEVVVGFNVARLSQLV